MTRFYTKILARRLKDVVKLNPLQKAFRELEACAEHIILIHGLNRDARKRNRSIFVVFLDLAKTFDSVNHDLLFRGLRRQSCPDDFIEVVKELYDGASTRISNGRSVTTEIEIWSGVKQGCSLSPLLFNIVIDKLVDLLDPRLGYKMQNAFPISIMAFADDLVLISESLTNIESPLKRTKTFMSRRGMKINPRKSYLMGLKKLGSKKQLCILTEPFLRVEISIFPRWGLAAPLDIWASSSAPEALENSLRSKVNATRLAWWDRLWSRILPKWRHGLAFGRISDATDTSAPEFDWGVWKKVWTGVWKKLHWRFI